MSNSYYEMMQKLAGPKEDALQYYQENAGGGALAGRGVGSLMQQKEGSYENLYYFDKDAKAKKIVSTLFGPKVRSGGKMQYKWKVDADKSGLKFKKSLERKVKKTLPKIQKGAKKVAPYAAAVVGGAGMHNTIMNIV